MKKILALRNPTVTETASVHAHLAVGAMLGLPGNAHEKVQMTPRQLLKSALPHLDAQDKTDLLGALGITIDAVAGEVLIETPNGQKRLLLGDPVVA